MPPPTRHGRKLSFYDFGRTTVHAFRLDQRFSYCLYVPENYAEDASRVYDLLVVVHGTGRGIAACRENFVALAERHGLIVLVPLFPAGMTGPGELSSYKMLRAGGIHYDMILLGMIDEISERYRVDTQRFALHGFSGGGHFTHRFFYLHPERLTAISIGAPGLVTLIDFERDFWVGLRDFEARFGKSLDFAAMRRVAVQMVIGAEDKETWEITLRPGSSLWMEGADRIGETRLDRMQALKASFEAQGIAVQHDIVPGVAHDGIGIALSVNVFLDDIWNRLRS